MLIEGCDASHMDAVACLSVALSTAVFATTIHTQDFKDEEGDRLIGRVTLPIVFPKAGRASVLPILVMWSIALSFVWQLTWVGTILFASFALFIGLRFYFLRNTGADQTSFLLYNVSPLTHPYIFHALKPCSGVVINRPFTSRLLAVPPVNIISYDVGI